MADITDGDTLTCADKRSQTAILYASPALATLTDAQAPTALAMVTQPGGASSGFPFTQYPAVRLVDGLGNSFALAGVVITVSSIDPGASGILNGDTATTDGSGVATFTNLKITLSATVTTDFTITFADLAGKLGTVASTAFPVVPVGTDSGALAEAVPGVALGTPTDSGTLGGETATAEDSNSKSDTDAFSFADKRTQVAALDTSATGTLSESAEAPNQNPTDTDSGTLGEASLLTTASGNDDFLLTDELTAVQVLELSPDGTLAEAYGLDAGVAVTDTGTLAEAATAAVTQNAPSETDTGTLSEASSLSSSFGGIVVDQVGADSGALAETAYADQPQTGTDSATLAEGTSVAVGQSASPSDADTAVLGEQVAAADAVAVVVETGTCVEDGAVVAVLVDTETATVDDILAALLAEPVATDTGTLVESSIADYGFTGVAEGRASFVPHMSAAPAWAPLLAGTSTIDP